jgi:hypothetical protein
VIDFIALLVVLSVFAAGVILTAMWLEGDL